MLIAAAQLRGEAAHCVTCCAGVEPPSLQIVEQHKWDESQYPTFDMEGVFNVRHYGAKGACAVMSARVRCR